jgi:hypothetical protein
MHAQAIHHNVDPQHCEVLKFSAEKSILKFGSLTFAFAFIVELREEIKLFNSVVCGTDYWYVTLPLTSSLTITLTLTLNPKHLMSSS